MFRDRDIISIRDFTRDELTKIFNEAYEMEKNLDKRLDILRDKVLALLFFEPSTRTMFSFQTAMYRLGGETLIFSDVGKSSMAKGETLGDTIRIIDGYSDCIVIRHWMEGAAKYAADIAESPVINAGDGTREHPTQTMIDLYTIWRVKGDVDNLNIGLLGDLKYGRAVTSLIYGLMKFDVNKLYLISPKELRIRDEVRDSLNKAGLEYIETDDIKGVLNKLDVLYVTRIQKERFPDPTEYERVRGSYQVDKSLLEYAREGLIILHPLPRVDEISYDVDETRHAYYFKQARYGVPVRMALLKLVMVG